VACAPPPRPSHRRATDTRRRVATGFDYPPRATTRHLPRPVSTTPLPPPPPTHRLAVGADCRALLAASPTPCPTHPARPGTATPHPRPSTCGRVGWTHAGFATLAPHLLRADGARRVPPAWGAPAGCETRRAAQRPRTRCCNGPLHGPSSLNAPARTMVRARKARSHPYRSATVRRCAHRGSASWHGTSKCHGPPLSARAPTPPGRSSAVCISPATARRLPGPKTLRRGCEHHDTREPAESCALNTHHPSMQLSRPPRREARARRETLRFWTARSATAR
jgi:hypothetical protein